MKIYKGSLQALLSSAPRGFAARSRDLARPVSLAQTGELARSLSESRGGSKVTKPIFSNTGKRYCFTTSSSGSRRPWERGF